MKKILIAIAFASIAIFSNATIPAKIQQLINEKDWNTLSTNNFDYSAVAKTLAQADADALVDASIRNKQWFAAIGISCIAASDSKVKDAYLAAQQNGFKKGIGIQSISVYWNARIKDVLTEEQAASMTRTVRQVLAADVEDGIKFIDVSSMCNFIFMVEETFNVEPKLPIQISDSAIQLFAASYNRTKLVFAVKSGFFQSHYVQIYNKYFNALPDNVDIATRPNVTWEKMIFFDWLNKYYGEQFNEVLYAKSNSDGKLYIATRLNDADKLLNLMKDITPDMLTADQAAKVLSVFNGQKSDWRPTEVLKALKDINSMYTIKLYDDRDTWEPILSKLRAMIEVRQ